MTHGDLFPDRRNARDALRTAARLAATGEVPRGRVAREVVRGVLRLGPKSGNEPELPPGIATLGTRLRELGYHVALKGKWHVTKPRGALERASAPGRATTASRTGSRRTPAATPRPSRSAAGPRARAGTSTTRARWRPGSRRPTCPSRSAWCGAWSTRTTSSAIRTRSSDGGYSAGEFADLRVPLPATIDEDLRDKPTVQALQKIGQTSYLGALRTRAEQQRYVDFYAHLHRVVDRKIGRLLARSATPTTRVAALAHRDRAHVGPRRARASRMAGCARRCSTRTRRRCASRSSSPGRRCSTGRATSDALVSLVDLVPTLVGLAGGDADGAVDGFDLGPVLRGERDGVRDAVLFTYDDHQAGTAFQEAPGQPNRIRCVRDERWKYAIYVDPNGQRRARVRALRPRERPRRGDQPRRQAQRRGPDGAGAARAAAAAGAARGAVRGDGDAAACIVHAQHAKCYHRGCRMFRYAMSLMTRTARLKSQAALAGQSLNEYLLARLDEVARYPTIRELAAQIRELPPYEGPSAAAIIREERDKR